MGTYHSTVIIVSISILRTSQDLRPCMNHSNLTGLYYYFTVLK